MDFEWDAAKAASNLRKHKISSPFAAGVFLDHNRLERIDDREDYGEARWVTIGVVDEIEISVVYTLRMEKIRMISARKANRDEIQAYWDRSI